MRFTTRQIVITGMLGGIAIFLGASNLGNIPVPTPAQHATIMHIPVIIGAILEGPLVGTLIGFIFGLYSFLNATNPFFADPLVAIFPRLLIGFFTYLVYRLIGGRSGIIAAAIAGTLTNTVGVLTMIAVRGYLPVPAVLAVGITHGLPEIVVAVIIVIALSPVLLRWQNRGLSTKEEH